jgi:NADH:ubiquinone oxidoreductase subunit 6 (subunit J)
MTLLATSDFWHDFFFMLFALLTCGFALAVLFSSNVVRMAFYLVLCLGSSSGLFFLAGAEFVGAMQLMIYVGGTLVLLIFGVMLTARASFVSMQTRAGEWVLALIVGGSLFFLLSSAAISVPSWSTPNLMRGEVSAADIKSSTPIGLGFTGLRVDKADQPDKVLQGGMSGYLLPFVIVSMHLLVVLVGAAYMARTKKRNVSVESMG